MKTVFDPEFTNQELFDAIQATFKNYREANSQIHDIFRRHLETLLAIQAKRASGPTNADV